MPFKQKLAYLALGFTLLPLVANAQGGLYKLPAGELGFGFAVATFQDATTISGGLDFGINKETKGSLQAGVSFVDDDELKAFGGEIPPSPAFGIGLLTTKPLGKSGLGYISQGSFAAQFSRVVDDITNETAVSLRTLILSGGLGFFKRVETESGLTVSPFFALFVNTQWATLDIDELGIDETESDTTFSAQMGLELEMSPTFSVLGGVGFSFEESDLAFSISVSFHPESAKQEKP